LKESSSMICKKTVHTSKHRMLYIKISHFGWTHFVFVLLKNQD